MLESMLSLYVFTLYRAHLMSLPIKLFIIILFIIPLLKNAEVKFVYSLISLTLSCLTMYM